MSNNDKNIKSHDTYSKCKVGILKLFKDVNGQITYFVDSTWEQVKNNYTIIFDAFVEKIENLTNINWRFYSDEYMSVEFVLYTEYKQNGVLFRSHFDYQSKGAWLDWVMVRWVSDSPLQDQPGLSDFPSLKY